MELQSRHKHTVLANRDQPVSFAELFFDLVFVFAITQVVHLIHGSFDLVHIARAVLVFWMVWWAWTQYSWALNAGNTLHRGLQLMILIATAIAFFMAVSVPEAFGDHAMWFAGAYVLVRSIGLAVYFWVTWTDESMQQAVKVFAGLSITGLIAALIGGIVDGPMQYALWTLTIALDVMAANLAGRSGSWNLHPRHFSERHGLFVIIALGETLIIAASAVTEDYDKPFLLTVTLLAIGITCALWWIYFFRAKERLEHNLAVRTGAERSKLARDAYSLLHFPLLCGLIIYSYALSEAMLHPGEIMTEAARLALAVGIFVFSIGIAITHFRATGEFLKGRLLVTTVICSATYFAGGLPTYWTMAIALAGLIFLCVWEEIFCPFHDVPDHGIDIE
jgi:low temperature requirement protein LtrA